MVATTLVSYGTTAGSGAFQDLWVLLSCLCAAVLLSSWSSPACLMLVGWDGREQSRAVRGGDWPMVNVAGARGFR